MRRLDRRLEVEINAVAALLSDDARPFLDRHLETLEQRRLVQRVPPRSLRFENALIQIAALQTMTRDDRECLSGALSAYLNMRDNPSVDSSLAAGC